MKMSLNDVTPDKMEKGIYKKFSFFKDQVEVSPKTNKMILPISIKETASKTIFRKSPKSEKTIIEGMNSTGIEEFFNTGDMLGTILTDVFSDINIYDDDIRLLQRRFVSPIGRGAISFYKYYLMDTLMVDRQECVHLTFVPQNPQDFGFTGHLYVVKDSTYAVKKCTMNLPKKTGVNFVENLDIVQQFEQLPDGNWVLTDDDMTVELHFVKGIQGLEVQRTTKYSDYQFTEIEPRLFRLKGNVIKEANMLAKSDEYWAESAPSAPHQEGEHDGRIHEPHRTDTGLQIRHIRCKGAHRELRGDGQQEPSQQVRLRSYQYNDNQQLRQRHALPSERHDDR